jgi:hypothetical protein
MSNAPIACTSCTGRHWTQREVMACHQFGPVANYRAVEPITERQLNYACNILGGSKAYAVTLSKTAASKWIDDLKRGSAAANTKAQPEPQPVVPAPVQDRWSQWQYQTPLAMVEKVKDARFAVRHDDNEPYKFLRITRPTHGKKKGALVIQSQHSDLYKDCVIVWPSGRVSTFDKRPDSYLLLVVADPTTASRRYGQELGRCCSCGRELTDGRSIHYGIGPECEKSWPEIIMQVDDEYGGVEYYPGITKP